MISHIIYKLNISFFLFIEAKLVYNHKNYGIIIIDSNSIPNIKYIEYYNPINIHNILENQILTGVLNKLNTI